MTIDKYFGSSEEDRKLGVFPIDSITNPNTYGIICSCDTYCIEGDREERFLEMWGRLENVRGGVINLTGGYPNTTADGKRSAFFHIGDCSVSLCNSPGVPENLQLSIYNPDSDKRIETLKILEEAFQH